MNDQLSDKWIKASIAGTIWAASEIVLGSFLHNLKVPFSGNILTAIGLVILISISYIWKEKGLFWRAGLVCSLMKTMSPSAVIFGPMIAIFAESLLLELFVRISGRTIAGYILGSMAAMSWNLFQQIINYIIFYGSGIIEVYSNLLKLAQKQLHLATDLVWIPVIVLLVAYALFGLLAAITGIMAGRKMSGNRSSSLSFKKANVNTDTDIKKTDFNYSIAWLAADIILIVFSFILLEKTKWIYWSLTVFSIIIIWSLRYKRALRQISRPKFWVFFVIITFLTAFIFSETGINGNSLLQGVLTGIQMNFRAAVIITGFAVLGTELYNPVIRNFFIRTSFKNLPLALELSAESLPAFIATIPDLKTLVRNPVSIFSQVISQADLRLSEIRSRNHRSEKIFLITGAVGEGKTTLAGKISDSLRKCNIRTAGILSERVMDGASTIGYDIVNIETGERKILMREQADNEGEKSGRFTLSSEGFNMGRAILNSYVSAENILVIVDEAGALELNGRGWSDSIDKLLTCSGIYLLITVRDSNEVKIREKWNFEKTVVFRVKDTGYSEAASIISDQFKS